MGKKNQNIPPTIPENMKPNDPIDDRKNILIKPEFRPMIENLIKYYIIKEAMYAFEIGVAIAIAKGLKWTPGDEKKRSESHPTTAVDQEKEKKYNFAQSSIPERLKHIVLIHQPDMPPYRCIEGLASIGLTLLSKEIPRDTSIFLGNFKTTLNTFRESAKQ